MNPKSTKKDLNLYSKISTVKNHSKPDNDWSEFEDINSPIYNGALSPIYYSLNESDNEPFYDSEANYYEVVGGALKRNDEVIMSIDDVGFKKEIVSDKEWYYEENDTAFEAYYSSPSLYIKEYNKATQSSTIHSQLLSDTASFLCGRWLKLNGETRFIALYDDRGKTMEVVFSQRTSTFYLGEFTWSKSGSLGESKIFGSDKTGSSIVCFVSQSGANIEMSTLGYTYQVFLSPGPNPSNAQIDWSNGKTVSTLTSDDDNTFCQIQGIASSLINKTCTKEEDKYYDENGSLITFSKGYVPRLVSGNTYSYTEYTTTWNYSMNFSKAVDRKINLTLSLGDSNYPDDIEDLTPSVSYSTSSNEEFSIYSVTIVSNNGYVFGDGFRNPTITFTQGADNRIYYLPSTAIGYTGFNKTKSYSPYTYTYSYYTTTSSSTFAFSDYVMLDDGYFYGYESIFGTNAATKGLLLNYKNEATVDSNIINISNAITSIPRETLGIWCMGTTLNIGQNWIRIVDRRLNASNTTESVFALDKASINQGSIDGDGCHIFEYDSSLGKIVLGPGVVVYSDTFKGCISEDYDFRFNNTTGARFESFSSKSFSEGFNLLYNSGYISGISYSDIREREGTLLTQWNSIDTDAPVVMGNGFVVYKNSTLNKWIKISKTTDLDWVYKYVENRYIVINTASYWNCFDTKLNKKVHYASDWNDRSFYGVSLTSGITETFDMSTIITATAENYNYSTSENTICSSRFPSKAYSHCYKDKVEFKGAYDSVIDYFMSELTSGNPVYNYTYCNGSTSINPKYVINGGATSYSLSTTSVMYMNPSLFTDFVYSGNNLDYMLEDGYAYSLLYDNTVTPILLASSSTYIDTLDAVFIIQSMPYGIMGDKIYSLSYLNGVYQGAEAIINVKGMKFIGNIPTEAYFYSQMNRSLYCFTGDANLELVKDCSCISEIYGTWYNTATQTIYFASDFGLYMINSKSMYRQEFFDVKGVYFLNDGSSVVVNKEDGKYKAYHLYYEYKKGLVTNTVRLNTGLYGTGSNHDSIIDRWSISLFNEQHLNGKVILSSQILTDLGTIEENSKVVEITSSMWDKNYHSILIDYVPKLQRGLGVGLKIESDFALSSIVASVSQDLNTTASRINI